MSDRPIGLGKVAENGTLNENGAFYSVQDINVLLEEKGGGGGDLPTPTVADAGKVVVIDKDGKYTTDRWATYDLVVKATYTGTFSSEVVKGNYYDIQKKLRDSELINFYGQLYTYTGGANFADLITPIAFSVNTDEDDPITITASVAGNSVTYLLDKDNVFILD